MNYQRKRVAKRLASGLLAGALALGGLAISGGTASAKTLTAASGAVVRVAGADRFATAAAVADRMVTALAGNWAGDIVVVSGADKNMPDALSAIQVSKFGKAPILLTSNDSLPIATRDWLIANRAAIQAKAAPKVHVVGGTSAVADSVVAEIVTTLNSGDLTPTTSSVRWGGDSRYSTNKAVNDITGMLTNTDKVYVVGGNAIADALSIGSAVYDDGVLVMTNGSELSPEALAVLSSYALKNATAGTAPSVTIVGGPSAVSFAVEEQIATIVNYRNIVRIQGVDRYATNLAVENAKSQGNKVIFASGTVFADALVASPLAGELNIDLVLMPPTGPTADHAVVLYGATDMWVAGGTAAVSAEVLTAAITAKAAPDELTTTLTCLKGSGSVTVTFQGSALSPDIIDTAGTDEGKVITNATHFSVNGVAAAGASGDLGAVTLDAVTNKGTAVVDVKAAGLATGDTVVFAGLTEAASSANRKIAGASCTVADDIVAPTFTIRAAEPDATGVGVFFVTASEPVKAVTAASVAMAGDGTTNTAFNGADITLAQGTGTAIAGATVDAKVTPLDLAGGFATQFMVSVGATTVGSGAALDTGNTISIETGGVADVSGLVNAAVSPVAVVADAAAPTVAASAVACTGTAKAGVTIGGFKLEAALATSGVSLNGWKLVVVDVPNKTIPSVVADATAKTVTVSADQYRVKADDVVAWANTHQAIPANWVFTRDAANAAPGTITPTTATSANSTTGGKQTCKVTLTMSELIQGNALTGAGATVTAATMTLNGVAVATPTVAVSADNATITVEKTLLEAGGTFVVTWTAEDLAGNGGGSSVSVSS